VSDLSLKYLLFGQDVSASKALKDVGKSADDLGTKAKKGMEAIGAGAIAAIAAVAVLSVKNALTMQESDARIQGSAQISAKAATSIGDAFLGTAFKSTFSGQEMADAFGPVAGVVQQLAGHILNASDAMTVMSAATTLAEASNQPLASTTSDLVAVMQSYHLKLSGASDASNILFNTSRLTGVGLDTLSATVDKLHGKLGIASPTLADTSGLMVDLAEHGIAGSRGLMVVNTSMSKLMGGSKSTSAELKALNVHLFDSRGQFVGLKSILEQATPKLALMNDKARLNAETALFGAGAAKAMNTTILAGATGLDKATAAVTKHGAAEKAAKAASSTWLGDLKMLKAAFVDITTEIGEKLIPVIVTDITWMTKHKTLVGVLAAVIGGLVVVCMAMAAATAIMTAATTAQAIATGVASAAEWVLIAAMYANPLTWIVLAIIVLVGAIYLIATKTTWFQTIWKAMTNGLGDAWRALWNGVLQPVITWILNGFANLAQAIGHVLVALGNIPGFGWAKTAGDFMLHAATAARGLAANLHQIPQNVGVNVAFSSNYSVVAAQIDALSNSKNKLAGMGHNAAGTSSWRGGPTWVGEGGAEIVDVPAGAAIHSHSASMRMAGGGGGDVHVHVNGAVYGTTTELANVVLNGLQQLKGRGVKLGLGV
jgi:TP901 family phage tail tape measure protein